MTDRMATVDLDIRHHSLWLRRCRVMAGMRTGGTATASSQDGSPVFAQGIDPQLHGPRR